MEVRHILVEKHAKALEVLEILNSGEGLLGPGLFLRNLIAKWLFTGKMAFNEAAREHSIDKAGRSGLLGWKRRNELDQVPLHRAEHVWNEHNKVYTQDFWAAALEVPEGKYTPEPVRTQYGYHIIKVEARK
jgi:parvulin-like peptidyl-prolyl isomerase